MTVTDPDRSSSQSAPPDAGEAAAATAYAARLSPRRIRLTVAGVLAGMFLAAVDGTVVSTAMPTVVGELGGISRYAWVFSAYLLAEVATIPLWGKFADMLGRKHVFLTGMAVFLAGSALSGMSQSMTQLILFRAVQGIGAGCLLPVASTIFGDLFTMEQRVKMAALFSAVFGFASIAGPLLGGFLTDNLDWRWVFYVNLPIGIAAIVVLQLVMVEPIEERSRHAIDWLGAGLLVAATVALFWALEVGGRDYPWMSAPVAGALAVAVVGGVLFVFQERRAAEPVLPLSLFGHRVMRPIVIVVFLLTMPMFGVLSYLPLFVQVVTGASATDAGRILTPLMLGSIIASMAAGRLILKAGYRPVIGASVVLTIAGLFLLTRLDENMTSTQPYLPMIVLGFGMGGVVIVGNLAAQSAVAQSMRGVASSLVNFVRQLGGAIGVAIGGSVFLGALSPRLDALFPGSDLSAADLMQPADHAAPIPDAVREGIKVAFAESLHRAFVACLVIAIVGAASALLVPKGRPADLHG